MWKASGRTGHLDACLGLFGKSFWSKITPLFFFSVFLHCTHRKSKTDTLVVKYAKLHFLSLSGWNWATLLRWVKMKQTKLTKKSVSTQSLFFLSNQSEREMVSQQFSPSSLLWLTWILLNNACAPPPSSRGRQFPNLHRVALNQSSKKYTHTQEVQRFCLYKCCDPDLDPDPDPHPNLTPKSASNEHWHRW